METFFLPEDNKAKKVHIETYGCQMNVADSEVIAAMLQTVGYEPTDNEEEAAAATAWTWWQAPTPIWNYLTLSPPPRPAILP